MVRTLVHGANSQKCITQQLICNVLFISFSKLYNEQEFSSEKLGQTSLCMFIDIWFSWGYAIMCEINVAPKSITKPAKQTF